MFDIKIQASQIKINLERGEATRRSTARSFDIHCLVSCTLRHASTETSRRADRSEKHVASRTDCTSSRNLNLRVIKQPDGSTERTRPPSICISRPSRPLRFPESSANRQRPIRADNAFLERRTRKNPVPNASHRADLTPKEPSRIR